MRYNSERLDINVLISGNGLLFKAIKISLGPLPYSRKMHALFRENRHLRVSSTANNQIRVSVAELKIRIKSYFLAFLVLFIYSFIFHTLVLLFQYFQTTL